MLSKAEEQYLLQPVIDSRKTPSQVVEIFAAVLYGAVGLVMGFVNKVKSGWWILKEVHAMALDWYVSGC